jgi:hypothetical protein
MDHIVADVGNNQEFWRPLGTAQGDAAWADTTNLGSSKAFFLENSTVNGGTGPQGGATNDCFSGGRFVVRFSILNNSSVQGHPTGHAGDDRGCRSHEFYKNTMTPPSGINTFNTDDIEAGTGVNWGNSANGYQNFVTIHLKRENTNTYTQTAPPGGWGYCGTAQTGSASAWDQNSDGPTGYACTDQPGRGQGDLLSGLFPNKVNTAQGNTIAWPRQKLEPIYEWNNVWSCTGCGGNFWTVYDPGMLANRDFFLEHGNTNCAQNAASCTAGVGIGTLAQRPANCTPNSTVYPAGNSPGVGWWATDQGTWNQSGSGGQGQLYVCTATNTWTLYYTPYTYPHPLTAGSGTPPAPPTGLQAIVN